MNVCQRRSGRQEWAVLGSVFSNDAVGQGASRSVDGGDQADTVRAVNAAATMSFIRNCSPVKPCWHNRSLIPTFGASTNNASGSGCWITLPVFTITSVIGSRPVKR